jgi:hypothetical protein
VALDPIQTCLKSLQRDGFDFHDHTVGDFHSGPCASRGDADEPAHVERERFGVPGSPGDGEGLFVEAFGFRIDVPETGAEVLLGGPFDRFRGDDGGLAVEDQPVAAGAFSHSAASPALTLDHAGFTGEASFGGLA